MNARFLFRQLFAWMLATSLLIVPSLQGAETPEEVRVAAVRRKFMQTIIPKLDFRDATVREAIYFLSQKSVQIGGEEGRLNIVLSLPAPPMRPVAPIPGLVDPLAPIPAGPPKMEPDEPRITLNLANIPMWEAVRYVAEVAHLQVKVGGRALELSPAERPAVPEAAPPAGLLAGKLEGIVIPKLEFREASLMEAVDFVRQKSRMLDQAEPDGGKRGINIVYVPRPPAEAAPAPPLLTIALQKASIGKVLQVIAQQSDLDLTVEEHAVILRARPAKR